MRRAVFRTFLLASLLPTATGVGQTATAPAHRAPQGPRAVVETIDLRQARGMLVELANGEVLLKPDGDFAGASLPLDELWEIRLAEASDPLARHGQALVLTAAGDRLAIEDVRVDDGTVLLRGSLIGRIELPLDAVRTLLLPGADTTPRELLDRLDGPQAAPEERDVVYLYRQGEWIAVPGALVAIDERTVRFRWEGREHSAARRSVPAIRLAGPAVEAVGTAIVIGRNGSRLRVDSTEYLEGRWRLDAAETGTFSCPAQAVAAVRFRSPRVTWLSELRPVRVEQYGLFGDGLGWRADEALAGGSIRLDGRRYDRGLAVHSFCELTFALDGRFEQFVARVGIDDAVRPAGVADVTFLGGGKPLAEPLTVTGADAPQTVRLNITGAATLTIRVDFGPDGLDAADHVDLADARLIRAMP